MSTLFCHLVSKLEMNGALRFFAFAFLLALCYHWIGDEDSWSDVEDHEDASDTNELIAKFSQSLHRKSGEQMVKGDDRNFKADLDELHSSKINITYFMLKFYYSSPLTSLISLQIL